jgi:hypothetical protein
LAELENPTFRGSPIKHNRHLFRSPYTIEFGERFIEAVLDNEPFGEDELTDVIFVNQKILDNIAHRMTADTEHFKEAMDALDLFMGRLLRSLDRRFGDDYMLLLTSDHGFGPGLAPPQKELDSRRLNLAKVVDQANSTLGVEGLVEDIQYLNVYLNPDVLKQSGKNLDDVCAAFSPYKWVEHCITLNELDVPDELRMQSGL